MLRALLVGCGQKDEMHEQMQAFAPEGEAMRNRTRAKRKMVPVPYGRPQAVAFTRAAALLAGVLLIGCGEKDEFDKQMRVLCAKDGGVRIYETVVLPRDQFDKWGMPRGKNWDREVLKSKLDPDYRQTYSAEFLKRGDTLKGEVEMIKHTERIYRQADGKLLGESVTYGRSGGDPYIALLLVGHPSGVLCPVQSKSLVSSVFVQGE